MLLEMHGVYGALLATDFSYHVGSNAVDINSGTAGPNTLVQSLCGFQCGADAGDTCARQRVNIQLEKKQQDLQELSTDVGQENAGGAISAPEPAKDKTPWLVDPPLVMQGPGAVA